MAERFYIRETAVAINLGIHRDRIRELRKEFLKEGVDWEQDGKPIKYSDAGFVLLKEKAGLPQSDEGGSPESRLTEIEKTRPGTDGEASEPVTLKVFRVFPNNLRILEAIKVDADPTKTGREGRYRVRVKDNSKFVRNMEIPCRLLHDDFYECVRQPRFRGKF